MTEAPEAVLTERNFLWQKCEELYNGITHNGAMNSNAFRKAVGVAGSLFKGKGVDMTHSNSWFTSIANFLEMVEKARSQKVGPKC